MTTLYDVSASTLIELTATKLKSDERFTPPHWAAWVKTGMHKEHPPQNDDWWYVRCAALLRRIAIDGPVGTQRLRTFYGGKTDNTSKPERFVRGSGAIIRKAMQQLESAGFVRATAKGREISAEGRSLLDNTAHEISKSK
ncbi:MAG TPA: 30S ribosomal protein S19e [Candidatus Acidoferrales bacterium]|jgi:small subunit ribosomal protein S19e|nr:30S ribosomal protein S19e [Candidatus Acidoferrales bacterium]